MNIGTIKQYLYYLLITLKSKFSHILNETKSGILIGMTVRLFLFGTIGTIIISWSIWGLIVSWLDPTEAGTLGFLLFFLAVFLAVASTSALLGYIVRRVTAGNQLPAHSVRPAIRQGMLLGLFVDLLLFLQLLRLMQWWVVAIATILFLSIEFVFLSYDRGSHRHQSTNSGWNSFSE